MTELTVDGATGAQASLTLGWDEPEPRAGVSAPARSPGTGPVAHAVLHPRASRPLTDHVRSVLSAWGWTYEIKGWRRPGAGGAVDIVSCRVCGHDSFHPGDLERLYCSFCNAFHEEWERAWQAELDARSHSDAAPPFEGGGAMKKGGGAMKGGSI